MLSYISESSDKCVRALAFMLSVTLPPILCGCGAVASLPQSMLAPRCPGNRMRRPSGSPRTAISTPRTAATAGARESTSIRRARSTSARCLRHQSDTPTRISAVRDARGASQFINRSAACIELIQQRSQGRGNAAQSPWFCGNPAFELGPLRIVANANGAAAAQCFLDRDHRRFDAFHAISEKGVRYGVRARDSSNQNSAVRLKRRNEALLKCTSVFGRPEHIASEKTHGNSSIAFAALRDVSKLIIDRHDDRVAAL